MLLHVCRVMEDESGKIVGCVSECACGREVMVFSISLGKKRENNGD